MKTFSSIVIFLAGFSAVLSLPALQDPRDASDSVEDGNLIGSMQEDIKELKRTTRQCPFSTMFGGGGGGFGPFGGGFGPFGGNFGGGLAPGNGQFDMAGLINMTQMALNVLTQIQAQSQGNNGVASIPNPNQIPNQ